MVGKGLGSRWIAKRVSVFGGLGFKVQWLDKGRERREKSTSDSMIFDLFILNDAALRHVQ